MTLEHLLHELHKRAVAAFPDAGFVFCAVEDTVDENYSELTLMTNLEDEQVVEVGRQFADISMAQDGPTGSKRRLH